MNHRSTRYAILGDGRLARHMRHYLSLRGVSCVGWARHAESDFNTVKEGCAETRLRAVLADASHVLLLVSDDALAPLLRRYPFLHQYLLIHCAGALSLPGVAGAHPLMTFGDTLYDLDAYAAIPFMVESGHDFATLFPALTNPHYSIATEHKALYHALCVMAGNFPQLLWQSVAGRLENDLAVPPEALRAYLHRSLDNFLDQPEHALTGPLARGDTATIARNQQALGDDPLASLYAAFVAFHTQPEGADVEQKAS